mgnify:CR=1 FL=1
MQKDINILEIAFGGHVFQKCDAWERKGKRVIGENSTLEYVVSRNVLIKGYVYPIWAYGLGDEALKCVTIMQDIHMSFTPQQYVIYTIFMGGEKEEKNR